jgi:hypothetical protein
MNARACCLLALAPLALAGCTAENPAKRPAVAPAATIVGEPQSCVPLAQIRETKIRDDWTIDFIGSADRAWRNTLTSRCPGLRSENAFTYETSLSQLCSSDIVYVLRTTPRPERGAGCGLGQFVPVRIEKR